MAFTISYPVSARNGVLTLTSEADIIRLRGDSANTLHTVVVSVGTTTLLSTSLYTDSFSTITLSGLQRLLEADGEAYGTYTATITVDGSTSLNVRLLRCSVLLPFSAQDYLSFAGPSLTPTAVPLPGSWTVPAGLGRVPAQRTTMARREVIRFYCASANISVLARVFYRSRIPSPGVVFTDVDLSSEMTAQHAVPAADTICSLELRTARFFDQHRGAPLAYTVRITDRNAGSVREAPFVVQHNHEKERALVFRDSFGYERYLYAYGPTTDESSFDRAIANVDGMLTPYNIEETQQRTLHTGPLTPSEALWMEDILRSRYVYEGHEVGNNVGLRKIPVVITSAETRRDNRDNSVSDYAITYRYTTRAAQLESELLRRRIFDDTFDSTYE